MVVAHPSIRSGKSLDRSQHSPLGDYKENSVQSFRHMPNLLRFNTSSKVGKERREL